MWSIFKSAKAPKSLRGSEIYDHVLGRRFDPGAQAEVFLPAFANPVFLFRGNGRLAGSRIVFQPPAVWVRPAYTMAGLGGIQAGQVVGQPLVDVSQFEDTTAEGG